MALAAFRGVFSQSRIALFAAIADVSESSALARNYGAFGVAFGLCFVLGPGVGAVEAPELREFHRQRLERVAVREEVPQQREFTDGRGERRQPVVADAQRVEGPEAADGVRERREAASRKVEVGQRIHGHAVGLDGVPAAQEPAAEQPRVRPRGCVGERQRPPERREGRLRGGPQDAARDVRERPRCDDGPRLRRRRRGPPREDAHAVDAVRGVVDDLVDAPDDDGRFVEAVIDELDAEFGVDRSRLFAFGGSNGGMAVHHLVAARLPGLFLGAAPVFGLPLLGYAAGGPGMPLLRSPNASRTSILQLHDRSDAVIPWKGGVDGDGWIYETGTVALATWAAVKGCKAVPTPENTTLSGGADRAACFAFEGCDAGVLRYCLYDGTHGVWPPQPAADALIWAFFTELAP